MSVFLCYVKGVHYISNASSILIFNILYVFAFIKMIYYEFIGIFICDLEAINYGM